MQAQAVSRAHPPRIDARSGAKQEQEVVRNGVAEKSSIQVCGPSHGQTRRAPLNSPAATEAGAPSRRIPERLPQQLATSARPLATVPAAVRGSTRCAELQPLPTPSPSVAFFLVCCPQCGWQVRPRPSASQGSPSLEPIALHVHASRIAFALRRTGHTRGEYQRCRNCAPGMGHYSGSCTGRKPPQVEARWSGRGSRQTRLEAHHAVSQNEAPRYYATCGPLDESGRGCCRIIKFASTLGVRMLKIQRSANGRVVFTLSGRIEAADA